MQGQVAGKSEQRIFAHSTIPVMVSLRRSVGRFDGDAYESSDNVSFPASLCVLRTVTQIATCRPFETASRNPTPDKSASET